MAWTAPRTWTAGEILTAALMNEQLRDNMNAIITDGLPSLVVAPSAAASMATSAAPFRLSATYTGTASETAAMVNMTFTDQRTTGNDNNQVFRINYVRSASASQAAAGFDAALLVLPSFNQSLTNQYYNLYLGGATVAATKTVTDFRAIRIADSSGSGAMTTQYGLYVDALAKGSTNYAIYTNSGDIRLGGNIGFYATTPAAKQTVSGSRGGNAALASLLTALATIGLITNSSSA
jgi:hypothetical protein